MFPIIEKYVDHEHTINGLGVNIHSTLSASIISNAKEVLSLHDRGYKLVFPNINNIYALMKMVSRVSFTADQYAVYKWLGCKFCSRHFRRGYFFSIYIV